MENNNLPKVLIVSRGVWDDTKGTSSTLANLFRNYDADKLAHIYIETKSPNTNCCNLFFQISEFSLIHKLYKWRTKTGFKIETVSNESIDNVIDSTVAQQEERTMEFVRKKRYVLFSFLRELLWLFNGWKCKELKSFVKEFNPDVIWLDGSPLILMNRLHNHVLKVAKKPNSIFLMDDVYTYKSCNSGLLSYLYKCFLRKSVKKVVDRSNKVFVASPKMKREYDEVFTIDSIFITKGIDFTNLKYTIPQINSPIKLVYLGQIIYGRIYTLIAIAEALKEINSSGIKIQMQVYTNNYISEELKRKLLVHDSVLLMDAVPYNKVLKVIANNDVLLFVESFEKRYKSIARLSFSTKITDYLSSGKCVLAIGPSDIAPMEYLEDEDAAIVVTDLNEVKGKLRHLLEESVIVDYSKKGFKCAQRNHDVKIIDKKIKNTLIGLSIKKTKF